MKARIAPLGWLTLNFLWYLFVSFFLSQTSVLAQAIVLPLALVLTIAQLLELNSVLILTLTGSLTTGLANALAAAWVGETGGYLATTFAVIVFLSWMVPGVWSAAIVGIISLAAALLWAKSLPLTVLVGVIWIGIASSIFAVLLPEVVTSTRDKLERIFNQDWAFLMLLSISLAGLVLGTAKPVFLN